MAWFNNMPQLWQSSFPKVWCRFQQIEGMPYHHNKLMIETRQTVLREEERSFITRGIMEISCHEEIPQHYQGRELIAWQSRVHSNLYCRASFLWDRTVDVSKVTLHWKSGNMSTRTPLKMSSFYFSRVEGSSFYSGSWWSWTGLAFDWLHNPVNVQWQNGEPAWWFPKLGGSLYQEKVVSAGL